MNETEFVETLERIKNGWRLLYPIDIENFADELINLCDDYEIDLS